MNLFKEFYPTPQKLIKQIFEDFKIDTSHYYSILEPSAGKGDLVRFIQNKARYDHQMDVDCIEADKTLRATLKGEGNRVIYDDFLRFHTCKTYDLILMNPPFSRGDEHLLKALSLVEYGGDVVCILNAETIKNPYTNRRKALNIKLRELGAKCRIYQSAFTTAERTSDVEVAAIYVSVPRNKGESEFLKGMKQKWYAEAKPKDCTDVGFADSIKNAILQYNIDVETGLRLIREYYSLSETFKSSFTSDYYHKIIELKVDGYDVSSNKYVMAIRRKYWEALFANPDFTRQMTSNLQEEYRHRIEDLVNYDFNEYNIREIKIDITKNLIQGVEECIIKLFDEMTEKHSWYPECDKNIHYFNGWATNKAWIINEKVIMPYNAFEYSYFSKKSEPKFTYGCNRFAEKMADIEKVLTYLDTKGTVWPSSADVLSKAEKNGDTRDIELKYITITVYKKGTCHIKFKDQDLLKKLNIYGCQHKGWLPPSYGKKTYNSMSDEEKQVIDEFEGKESYEDTFRRKDYFLSGAAELLGIEKIG